MSWIWGSGGTSLFDFYSLHHVVWFIAITTVLYPVFKKNIWAAALAVAFMWEIFEQWVVQNVPTFPFAGKEDFINKVIGDPISNCIGFLIAFFIIKSIGRENER